MRKMWNVPLTTEKEASEEIPQSKNAENAENADTKTRKMWKMRMTGFNVTTLTLIFFSLVFCFSLFFYSQGNLGVLSVSAISLCVFQGFSRAPRGQKP